MNSSKIHLNTSKYPKVSCHSIYYSATPSSPWHLIKLCPVRRKKLDLAFERFSNRETSGSFLSSESTNISISLLGVFFRFLHTSKSIVLWILNSSTRKSTSPLSFIWKVIRMPSDIYIPRYQYSPGTADDRVFLSKIIILPRFSEIYPEL